MDWFAVKLIAWVGVMFLLAFLFFFCVIGRLKKTEDANGVVEQEGDAILHLDVADKNQSMHTEHLASCKYCSAKVHFNIRKCPHCLGAFPSGQTYATHHVLADSIVESSVGTYERSQAITSLMPNAIVLTVLALIFGGFYVACSDSQEEKAQKAEDAVKRKVAGFHCLSGWDGSHREVVEYVKAQLRDPASFEHINTRIAPANEMGIHALLMKYRATNGFGGKVIGEAAATVDNNNCSASIVAIDG